MASNASMIALDSVYKTYPTGNTALNGISLNIDKGEFVFIVGPSGSGKTTLFKLLLKELEPTSGTIFMNGQNIRRLKRRHIAKMRRGIGVVFQDFRLLKDRTVYENIAFAQRVVGKSTKFIKESVPKLLETVGLQEKGSSNPNQLSGGEQQRVALARALANNPPVILADEPTGNLDPENAWLIMNLLDEINKTGTTVIVVTHNTSIVRKMNKRVITMNKGVIVDDSKGNFVDIKLDTENTNKEQAEIAFEKFKEAATGEPSDVLNEANEEAEDVIPDIPIIIPGYQKPEEPVEVSEEAVIENVVEDTMVPEEPTITEDEVTVAIEEAVEDAPIVEDEPSIEAPIEEEIDVIEETPNEEPIEEDAPAMEEIEMTEEELAAIFKTEPDEPLEDIKDMDTFSMYEEFLDDEEKTADLSEVIEEVQAIEDERKGGETE